MADYVEDECEVEGSANGKRSRADEEDVEEERNADDDDFIDDSPIICGQATYLHYRGLNYSGKYSSYKIFHFEKILHFYFNLYWYFKTTRI